MDQDSAPKTDQNDQNNDLLGRWIAGFMLIFLSAGFIAALAWRLLANSIAPSQGTMATPVQVNEAIIMALAGGVGSSVSAIRAYLEHACDKHDFKRHYIPWYGFWQLQGLLLGLIFYFAVRGGIILLTIKSDATATELNIWSLAAIGALGGLFSQDAIKKLQQVFEDVFTTS